MKHILNLIENSNIISADQTAIEADIKQHVAMLFPTSRDKQAIEQLLNMYIPTVRQRIISLSRTFNSIGRILADIVANKEVISQDLTNNLNLSILTNLTTGDIRYADADRQTLDTWAQKTNIDLADLSQLLTSLNKNFYNALSDATAYRIKQYNLKKFYTDYEIYLRDRKELFSVNITKLQAMLNMLQALYAEVTK